MSLTGLLFCPQLIRIRHWVNGTGFSLMLCKSLSLKSVSRFVLPTGPWYSPTLCRIRRQRDRLYQRFKKLPADHRLSVCYRRVQNWYVAELRNAEKCYYRNISSQLSKGNLLNDAHKWWSIAKKSCGLQTSDSPSPVALSRSSLSYGLGESNFSGHLTSGSHT